MGADDEIASFEATHYNALAGRVQDAAAAVHSYRYLCGVKTVLIDDGAASWRLDLMQMKVQTVCLLEDQDLSDWTKQYTGKASPMPDKVKNAIKHLSQAPGSGHTNQKSIDAILPWLKTIGLDQVLLAIVTCNLRVTVNRKTKMTMVARQHCIDMCSRLYKNLPPEMKLSREQLQFERDNCVKNPTIILVDLNKVASMLHTAWRNFYVNLSDAEKEHHQHVRTAESILALIDVYLLVSTASDKGKFQHRLQLRKQVQARKKPSESIRDCMGTFGTNVCLYERETGEQYFPDPTPEECSAADAQEPRVIDSVLANGRKEYNIYTEGRVHIIKDTLVDEIGMSLSSRSQKPSIR